VGKPQNSSLKVVTLSSGSRKIEAIERSRDRGIGAEASLDIIFQNPQAAECVELFPKSRVVVLDVRYRELRHTCDEDEWKRVKRRLEESGIQTRRAKWWGFHLR
jgi:hypothetical protein